MKKFAAPIAALALAAASLLATPEAEWLDLQLEQIELESKYREKHPKVKAFKEDLENVHRDLGDPDFEAYAARASLRLLELRLEEVELEQRYRAEHPKLELVRRQIAFLETIPGAELNQGLMEAALRKLDREHQALQQRYREAHPDIKTQQAQIAFLETELAKQPTRL